MCANRVLRAALDPPAARWARGARDGLGSFSSVPLEAWTWLGTAVAVLSFLYGGGILAKTLIFGGDVPGYASLLASILFLGGVQLLGMGIISRYLGRMYTEIKQRPVYLVRRTYEGR